MSQCGPECNCCNTDPKCRCTPPPVGSTPTPEDEDAREIVDGLLAEVRENLKRLGGAEITE